MNSQILVYDKFYQLMKSSHLNYITIIANIHMEPSMHINVCIPVLDTVIMLAIIISLRNEGSLRSSDKLANFFRHQEVIFIS